MYAIPSDGQRTNLKWAKFAHMQADTRIGTIPVASTKCGNFRILTVTYFLREINFEHFRSSKPANFSVLAPLNFSFGKFQSLEITKSHQNFISEPQQVSKWQFLDVPQSL